MRKDKTFHLNEAIATCRLIMEYVSGINEHDFVVDNKRMDAVCMRIIYLAQCLTSLLKVDPTLESAHPNINWRGVISTRNRMAHDYGGTDYSVIWDTCVTHVPVLLDTLELIAGTSG